MFKELMSERELHYAADFKKGPGLNARSQLKYTSE